VASKDVGLGPLPGARGAEQDEDPHRGTPAAARPELTG